MTLPGESLLVPAAPVIKRFIKNNTFKAKTELEWEEKERMKK